MANNPYVNKVQFGNQTLIDLTSDTVTADKLMQGYTAHDRTGAIITGTATGGEYTRAVIVPQQTVTPNSSRVAVLSADGTIEDAKNYIVTLDGVEWFTTAETLWSSNYVIGDPNWFLVLPSNYVYPFGVATEGSTTEASFADTNQHTIKVERIELLTEGVIDGNNLKYGIADATSSLVGVGKVGSMIIE